MQLPADAPLATIEAAIEHAKAESTRRKQAEIFGIPYEPRPFEGTPRQDGTSETLAKVRKLLRGSAEARGEKIATLIELQAKAGEVAGKPPLSKAEAFEAAARELESGEG